MKLKNVNTKLNAKVVDEFHKSLAKRNKDQIRRVTMTELIGEMFVKHAEKWK